jgi:hemerythrin-like domain-containing protein
MEKNSNTLRFLMDDHKRMKGLFRQFDNVDERAHVMKAGVCEEIFMELEIHTEVEEEFFYPTLQDTLKSTTLKAMVEECTADHEQVKTMIEELKTMGVYSEYFDERMGDLIVEVEQHIDKEESELFSTARDFAFDAIEQICDRMAETRAALLKSPKYQNAQPRIVQDPSGGEQKRRPTQAA